MARISRRTVYYLGLVVGATALLTVVYNFGMDVFEGESQPLYQSLEVVVQSFTTTGYGEDAPWQSPQMNLLVIAIQLTGIGLILTAVDVFAVPWLRTTLSPSAPEEAPAHEGHIVVCGYTSRTAAFMDELRSRDRAAVVVEADEALAIERHKADDDVVHGDPESTKVLEAAHVGDATAVVVDAPDDATASTVLSAREVNPEARIVALVEDRDLAPYLDVAGADQVLSPRQLLGESIASEVPTAVSTLVEEEVDLGGDFQLAEVGITASSDLCGSTFEEASLRERFDLDVVGAWIGGDFESPPPPADAIESGTRLLVAGEAERIDALRAEAATAVTSVAPQDVIVAGYGESGQAAANAFEGTSARLTVLDVEDRPAVDVVGDARDPETLAEAGIDDAAALIVTVADDTTAILTTLIARDRNPDVRLVVRANQEADVTKLYRAGADFVQSLATVSGRMLASTVFEDEEVFVYDKQISVVGFSVGDLAGQTITEADVRTRTGVTVLAVIRDGEPRTDFDAAELVLQADDEVVVAGTDESVREFEATFVD